MDITLHGIELKLLPEKAVLWSDEDMLLLADPHFGKSATFRAAGIPVPTGSTLSTFTRINTLIEQYRPTRVVILGDMFHHRTSLSEEVRIQLDHFFDQHCDLEHTLVLGNHDVGIKNLPRDWNLHVTDQMTVGRVGLMHDPAAWPSDQVELSLCGHLHPSIRVASRTDAAGKLPCFWYSRQRLVLPAIGHFTGTHPIKPKGNDQAWIVAEDQVIEYLRKPMPVS